MTPQPLTHETLTTWLQTVAPFSELDPAVIEPMAQKAQLIRFEANQPIASCVLSQPNGLWVVADGSVALLDQDNNELETRTTGELFGHAIAFDVDEPIHAYQAIGQTRGQLVHLPSTLVHQLRQDHALIDQFLSARPGDRLRSVPTRHTGRLSDLGLRSPITGTPDQTIQACAERMARHHISCLPLVGSKGLLGIVTDRDLRTRVLATGLDPNTPVSVIMTTEPMTISEDGRIDDAMERMMEAGIHHLPVVDEGLELKGVVSAGDLFRVQAPHPLRLARDIQRANTVDEVAKLAQLAPSVLAHMAQMGSEVNELGRIASLITDAATKRLLTLAEHELGPAPMAWCWLAFGSQARMEQGLITDQDNGLVLAETPDEAAAAYFKSLATYVCDGLNACGYVYCNGGVMAMGQWRMGLAQWQKTFDQWMREPDPQSVMHCSIFFDQRPIAGDLTLGQTLQQSVLTRTQEAHIFLRFLAAESTKHTPALGLFRQFLQETREDVEKSQSGKGINLKKRGVLPIVDLARVRALESGLSEVSTEARIKQAADLGMMNEHDAEDLIHAFRFIGNVRLKHQVRRFESGLIPDHLVEPDTLSGLHQRYLRSAFGIIRQAQKALALRYQL